MYTYGLSAARFAIYDAAEGQPHFLTVSADSGKPICDCPIYAERRECRHVSELYAYLGKRYLRAVRDAVQEAAADGCFDLIPLVGPLWPPPGDVPVMVRPSRCNGG